MKVWRSQGLQQKTPQTLGAILIQTMPINESHPIMITPKTNITLWRYMDIPSFISLLVDESLTFVRADLFEDKYEGRLPNITAELIDKDSRLQIEAGKLDKRYWNLSELLNRDNKSSYLNCWCNESHEMVHMWKIYSKENGVAIETDYQSLKESLLTTESIMPTEIQYIDFKKDIIDWKSNGLTVYTLKRKEYKSEKEFRLILSHPRIIEDQLLKYKTHEDIEPVRQVLYHNTPIIKCKVDISKLIKNIYISPYAPKWYLDMIKGISIKYNLNTEFISQSDL